MRKTLFISVIRGRQVWYPCQPSATLLTYKEHRTRHWAQTQEGTGQITQKPYTDVAFCLQGGIKKVKAQLKLKLPKADKVKEKGYSKDIGNTRKTKKTVGPLFSDTGENGGLLAKPHPWQNGLDNNKCEDGNLCVCESNKHNCLTGYMPKTGHAEEQEDCQLH